MKRRRTIFAVLILALVAVAPAIAGGAFEKVPLLVDAQWLEEKLGKQGLIVVDFGRSREDYDAGHIPGAVYLERDSVYGTVNGVPGMLPPPETAVPYFEEAGISNSSRVVIYDAAGGLWAARLFWGLEYFGHKKVHILDGGFPNWVTDDRLVSTNAPTSVDAGSFKVKIREKLAVDTQFILNNLESENVQIVDTRSSGEFLGDDVRADRGGHIPGAVNVDWVYNLDEDRLFLPRQELEEFYDTNGLSKDKTQVTHCQTGVRGAHTYFVLRYLGFNDVRLYDESWVVWGNAATAPVAQ